jgi:hypothetical protein
MPFDLTHSKDQFCTGEPERATIFGSKNVPKNVPANTHIPAYATPRRPRWEVEGY